MNNHQTLEILKTIQRDVQAIRDTGNIGIAHQAAARAAILVNIVRRNVEKQEARENPPCNSSTSTRD